MIDVLCAVAVLTPVNGPLTVNVADASLASGASSARSFRHRDSFTHVLSDLLVPAEGNNGETTFSVNSGCCHCESEREFLVHLGKQISPLTLLVGVAAPTTANQSF
jgi:hypothetical protein